MAEASEGKVSQRSLRRRRRELRHRAQSLVEGATDPWEEVEEYETVIPEGEEDEFIDEETAEVAEEVIEFTYTIRELGAEMILGYVWWSLFHGIAPMIWFYPLNELEISGYEAFVITILSPIFTGISMLLQFSGTIHGLAFWRVLSLVGVASFQAPTTLIRLVMLASGCGTAMLWFCGMIWSKDPKERLLSFWGLILGLFLLLVLRISYITVNPIWSDVTSNRVVLLIAVIATLDRVYTGYMMSISQSGPQSKSLTEPVDARVSGPGWFLVALGFGALMFLTHDVFGEVSLVCRWAVSGYPHTGPKPNPWGAAVIIALGIGVLLSRYNWTSNLFWWLVGSAGAALLYFAPRYWSLIGGLMLGVYTMSIWPAMIDRLFCRPVARTLTLANLVYIVLVLGSVWVVAFNFVPGGEYTRERTHVLLGITMVLIGLALRTKSTPDVKEAYGKIKKEENVNVQSSTKQKPLVVKFNNVAFVEEHGERFWFFKTHVIPVLVCLVMVAVIILAVRYHRLDYVTPQKEDPNVFSAMIWTVHFAYDNVGWPSFERAAQMINDTDADVVGFLESDTSKPYLGNHDLAMWFEERLGMYSDFGPSTRDHTWGATLLSKYPIVKSLHHLLPSPKGELAPALSATINITGNLVDFVLVHMGNDRDNLDRKLQAQELARIMDESPNPVVFLGYVTSSPKSRDYRVLTEKGRTKDIDETDSGRWCEYIMYRGLVRLGYARISHGGLSDTEVQMAKFRIPPPGEKYEDNDILTKSPKDVPENIRFPTRFGAFYKGHYHAWQHHYHMSTPKYFLPAEKQSK
ncbi:PGAP2-interacting protein-like [Oculina patagonica]